jgi:hypothetical protein
MGCEFSYEGSLPDPALQEKVVSLVVSACKSPDLMIHPLPGRRFPTRIQDGRDERRMDEYPFDFYGVIPLWGSEIWPHGQFIFDREAGGRLGHFSALPADFPGAPPGSEGSKTEADVQFVCRGDHRLIDGSASFAFLLNLIRIRFWPELQCDDDYLICEEVEERIRTRVLRASLENEGLDFEASWRIYSESADRC